MAVKLKYKESEFNADTILWDRDTLLIDFNNYWSRIAGSIAQRIAERTTTNWNQFNPVRTEVIKLLGINSETLVPDMSAPLLILPVNIIPSLLASSLTRILREMSRDELNELFKTILETVLSENQKHIKISVVENNINKVKTINKDSRQILVTNDSKENNELFLKECNSEGLFYQCLFQTNKEQLNDLLKDGSVLITNNLYLNNLYLKRGFKNILLADNLNSLIFTPDADSLMVICIDGASRGNPGPASIGIAMYKDGNLIQEISENIGVQTNNFAEYTALIRALEISTEKGYQKIEIRSDSELVVKQIKREYKVKDADIKELFDKASGLIDNLSSVKLVHVKREENLRADKLANKALNLNRE